MTCCKHKEGLTLIEVVIATTILALVLTGFLSAFTMNQKSVSFANNQQKAMHQARGVMEDLFTHSYYDSQLSVGFHLASSNCYYSVTESNKVKTITVALIWTNALQKTASVLLIETAMSHAIHK